MVERKVCFILEASNLMGMRAGERCRGRLLSKGLLPQHWQSVGKSFYREREAPTFRNSTVCSDSHLEIDLAVVWSGSSCLCTFSLQSRVSLLPFLWVQFSELWQLMSSWQQSGHHVVNFFHLLGISISIRYWKIHKTAQKERIQSITYSFWRGIKSPWLCLMTKLLIFGLIWLFSFVSAFFSLIWLNSFFC